MSPSIPDTRKSRGRPRIDATQLAVRMPPRDLARLDAWISKQPVPKPSRPEAMRRLVAEALGKPDAGSIAAASTYRAIRVSDGRAVDEWQGRAPDDESAAHRLGQHFKTKLDQKAPGYGLDDLVTLTRPDGEI